MGTLRLMALKGINACLRLKHAAHRRNSKRLANLPTCLIIRLSVCSLSQREEMRETLHALIRMGWRYGTQANSTPSSVDKINSLVSNLDCHCGDYVELVPHDKTIHGSISINECLRIPGAADKSFSMVRYAYPGTPRDFLQCIVNPNSN